MGGFLKDQRASRGDGEVRVKRGDRSKQGEGKKHDSDQGDFH